MGDKNKINKTIEAPKTPDIQKHGLIPTPLPIVNIKPPEQSNNGSNQNNSTDKK